MNKLHVRIDRLTLEGVSRAEARLIGAAIERHLTALANGRAAAPATNAPLPHPAAADAIGKRVATHVFRSVGGRLHV